MDAATSIAYLDSLLPIQISRGRVHPGLGAALADVHCREIHLSILKRLLNRWRDWLACSNPLQRVDLIFVLAGRRDRKAYGAELLRQGWAREILLSTLSADSLRLSRFAELHLPAWPRLLELQDHIPPLGRFFFLHHDGASWRAECLPVRPLGTLNEIAQLARWLRQHPAVRSVLIVSSGSHLRRIRLCCRAFLPTSVKFLLAEVPPDFASRSASESIRRAGRLMAEYAKLCFYRIVLAFFF